VGPAEVGLETGEELSFRRSHVPLRVLKELRRGKYAIQDELDLHGLTANEARIMLREFMANVLLGGRRCVRIVHGKGLRSGPGGPVLKVKLNQWLPQWEQVLAFTTAPARDGGTGAIYVLLAR
jgi:DNA-nicking Smr family endonuclease